MKLRIFGSLVLVAMALFMPAAQADTYTVKMQACAFSPTFKGIFVGDSITWNYNEGTCAPANHRVESFSGPQSFDSSPTCSSADSLDASCMNSTALQKRTFTFTFDQAGTYKYYCPFHGSISGGNCSGMCGQIVVNAQPTQPPPTSASPTPSATASSSPRPTSSSSVSPSPSPSDSLSPSPSPTATASKVAQGSNGGGGGSRALIAVAAIGILGGIAFGVYRGFIAQR